LYCAAWWERTTSTNTREQEPAIHAIDFTAIQWTTRFLHSKALLLLKSLLGILSGNALAALLSFARNLIVARMLTVEDYGIAATFALSMTVVEMLSTVGLQQLIVQARDGNDPRLQAGLQAINLLRGLAAALALFLLADHIARFFGVPELGWAYCLLAMVPIARGLENLDIHRLTREKRYLPMILYRVLPMAVALAAVWPLGAVFDDYQVMLYSLLVQYAFALIVSHIVSTRRFKVTLDTSIFRRSIEFGWPLLLNNILLFVVMQGDRLIVASELGLVALAIFSLGLTLTMTPALILAQSIQLVLLPRLSAAQDNPVEFARTANSALDAAIVSGLLVVLFSWLVSRGFVEWFLGDEYVDLVVLLVWFSLWQAISPLRTAASIIAIAKARNQIPLRISIIRASVLPLAWLAAQKGADLSLLIQIAIFGEVLAAAYSFYAIRSLFLLRQEMLLKLITMATLTCILVTIHSIRFSGISDSPLWLTSIPVVAAIATFYVSPSTRASLGSAAARDPR
jgi:O-antigen/teichoic acid export membrane protein